MEIKDLQPQVVFSIFDEITKVPRPSKKEEKIRQYLRGMRLIGCQGARYSCKDRCSGQCSAQCACHPRA